MLMIHLVPVCLLSLILVAKLEALEPLPLAWGPHRDLVAKPAEGGGVEITLGEGNPHFWTGVVPKGFQPDRHQVFEMDCFAPAGVESAILRARVAGGEMAVVSTEPIRLSEAWQPWAVDLSQMKEPPAAGHPEMRFHVALNGRAGTVIRLRNFRVREMNAEELRLKSGREKLVRQRNGEAEQILSYVQSSWPVSGMKVSVGAHDIRVSGKAPLGKLRIHGLPPEKVAALMPPPRGAGITVEADAEGRFEAGLPRIEPETQRDRALWRWRIADDKDGKWLSAACWPTETSAELGGSLPRMESAHPKGLGGVPPLHRADHEIFQLGIGHVTLNMVLNALLRDSPAPGHASWTCEGREYFYNEALVHSTDATLRHLQAQKIIVSCILLVGNHRHADGTPHLLLTHPEAGVRGIFSMPNLTMEAGVRLYGAAVRLLAERYDGSPRSPGRISNWILHNEVDQAGTWTNMGDQPLARYLESYQRSARIVHHTVRLFDRQSRVFMSLTHHWTKQSHGEGTYVVRDMLEMFAKMARAEGDFEWGVAYHPYPRDLRNPDTWKDAELTGGFDTPYITPKNLEVLPAYLKQEHLRFQGKVRGLLLSEQGFNSPTLSEADQRRQAAGLVYVFRKLKTLPEVEAYHLHRYQDMPAGEGGLRLGLIDENGVHKLAWDVYREIGSGSAREREFEAMAEKVWSEP